MKPGPQLLPWAPSLIQHKKITHLLWTEGERERAGGMKARGSEWETTKKEWEVERLSASTSNLHNCFQWENTCDDGPTCGKLNFIGAFWLDFMLRNEKWNSLGILLNCKNQLTAQMRVSWERALRVTGCEDGCLTAPDLPIPACLAPTHTAEQIFQ